MKCSTHGISALALKPSIAEDPGVKDKTKKYFLLVKVCFIECIPWMRMN